MNTITTQKGDIVENVNTSKIEVLGDKKNNPGIFLLNNKPYGRGALWNIEIKGDSIHYLTFDSKKSLFIKDLIPTVISTYHLKKSVRGGFKL